MMIGSGMMKDDFAKAYNRLVQKYNKQGYLTEDDFIAITEKFDIPLIKLSELQDKLYSIGAEIVNLSAVHITDLAAWCKIKFESSSSMYVFRDL